MDLYQLLMTKRTHRKYCQQPVSKADLEYIMQAQQCASCRRNEQSLRYIAVCSPNFVKEVFSYTHWAGQIRDGSASPTMAEMPAAFILVLEQGKDTIRSYFNAGLAVSNITLAAWERGIGSCILGNIARAQIKKILKISENMELLYAVALGYPSDSSRIMEVDIGTSTKYFLDAAGELVVPKYRAQDVTTYV